MPHPEAPFFFRFILSLHILAGSIALFAVPVALAVTKGGAVHRRFGLAYVVSMFAVGATALICAPYFQDYFLLLVAIFSSYLTFVGWRTLRRKNPKRQPAAAIDWAGAGAAVVAGLGMEGMAIFQHGSFGSFSIVLAVFGFICAGAGARSFVRFRRPPERPGAWLFEHFGMMLAAYIATVTAFSAVNFHFMQPVWLRWLWPSVIGTIVIAFYTRRYEAKFAKAPPAGAFAPTVP